MLPSDRRRNAYEVVLLEVRRRIERKEFVPGSRLPTVAEMASLFSVSAGPVREALRILQSQGVVRIEHGRGLFVAEGAGRAHNIMPQAPDIQASLIILQEARAIIEPELAALAAQRASDAELATIVEAAEALSEAKRIEDRTAYLEADLRFHRGIARASGNTVLERMLDAVHDLLVDSRHHMMDIPHSNDKAIHYHVLIATAIRQRNPVQARAVMQAHLHDVMSDVEMLTGPLAEPVSQDRPATDLYPLPHRAE